CRLLVPIALLILLCGTLWGRWRDPEEGARRALVEMSDERLSPPRAGISDRPAIGDRPVTKAAPDADPLVAAFESPPESARPWVYWFWNNANVNRAGITADLEAMKRAGIGGVIIMDVVQPFAPPRGTAAFMNSEWQDLFRFSVGEARRLGLEI